MRCPAGSKLHETEFKMHVCKLVNGSRSFITGIQSTRHFNANARARPIYIPTFLYISCARRLSRYPKALFLLFFRSLLESRAAPGNQIRLCEAFLPLFLPQPPFFFAGKRGITGCTRVRENFLFVSLITLY